MERLGSETEQRSFPFNRDHTILNQLQELNERRFLPMRQTFLDLCSEDGQDIAEYAVMVAVILIIVVGTLRLIGSNSNSVFSQAASSIG